MPLTGPHTHAGECLKLIWTRTTDDAPSPNKRAAPSEKQRVAPPPRGTARSGAQALRALIEKVVLFPGDKRGELCADFHDQLAAILTLGEPGKAKTRTAQLVARVCGHTHSIASDCEQMLSTAA